MKKRNKVGCLILLLVAGGVGALLWPAISGVRLYVKSLEFGNNGKQIHIAIFDAATTAEFFGTDKKTPVWPIEGQYETSTEFFKSAMINSIKISQHIELDDFTLFGAPGVKSPKDPSDPEQFTAENNAWCVVLQPNDGLSYDDHNIPDTTPFLFSKNIGFGTPPGPPKLGDTIADMSGLIKGVKPFGDKVGVIITFGGAVYVWPETHASQTNFNPTGASLQFLVP